MKYYPGMKKNEILPFATAWVELRSIVLSKISGRQILYDSTHMWNLRNKTNEQRGWGEGERPKNSLFTLENTLLVTRGEVGGQGGNR